MLCSPQWIFTNVKDRYSRNRDALCGIRAISLLSLYRRGSRARRHLPARKSRSAKLHVDVFKR
ncbi:hypothetical protein PSAB6_390011 [Paraburkholderia sabiae]|nr:hypothetical protein PSAB6_390011 [Paraburkholderia sabiae]